MFKYSAFLCLFLLCLGQTVKAQTPQLWGMTRIGGNYYKDSIGNGTIFKLNLDGSGFDTTHAFNGSNGYAPTGTLLKAMDGKLYGMTPYGGKYGAGVIFNIDPSDNNYTDVYDFQGYPTGGNPFGSLIQDSSGTLYGMTYSGGGYSFGVIFSFNPANTTYNDLYDFQSTTGGHPYFGNLIIVNKKLYGLTSKGGAYTYGVLFSFNPADSTYSDLHDFGNINVNDGENPYGSLLQAANGKLYGMCLTTYLNSGCIFSFNPDSNTYKELYIFGWATFANPYGSLIQVNDSTLCGMTFSGGYTSGDSAHAGSIFSFNLNSDSLIELYNFNGTSTDLPYGSLLQASNKKLYGMTSQGDYGSGNIFSFDLDSNSYADVYDFNNDSMCSNPIGSLIEITSATGINQLSATNSHISIFPNPVSTQLSVRSNLTINKIDIKNILGQTLIENSFNDGMNYKTIDVSRLSQGIYFITITSNTQTTSLMFIVSR